MMGCLALFPPPFPFFLFLLEHVFEGKCHGMYGNEPDIRSLGKRENAQTAIESFDLDISPGLWTAHRRRRAPLSLSNGNY